MTTEESNKLIAEFMGCKPNPNGYGMYACTGHELEGDNYFPPSKMGYATSWDWLMPVGWKIESLSKSDAIKSSLLDWMRNHNTIYDIKLTEATKEATYKAVVEFIEWYNENKG